MPTTIVALVPFRSFRLPNHACAVLVGCGQKKSGLEVYGFHTETCRLMGGFIFFHIGLKFLV